MSQSYRYQAMFGISSIEKITPQIHTIQKEIIFQDLAHIADDIDEHDIIMCHESYLHIINHHFTYSHQKTPLTANYLLHVIQSCIPSDNNRTYHNTLIDSIIHNDQMSQYCIGKTGNIQCMLHIILIRSDLYCYFKHKQITRYPQSRSSLSYISTISKTDSYCILYIYEHSLKLLLVKNYHFYQVYTLSI